MKPLDWLKPEAIGSRARMVAMAVMRMGRWIKFIRLAMN